MRRLALILLFLIPTVSAFSAQTGFPKTLNGVVSKSLVSVDLDGDGFLEMVVITDNGDIHVLEANGIEAVGWPKSYSGGEDPTPLAVGNLNGSGDPEIVVIFGIPGHGSPRSDVTAWWSNGSSYWTYIINTEVTSSPALADLDGDGKLDVVFGSWDNNVTALYYNGTKAWSYTTGDTIDSSFAVADIDQDGDVEVLIPSTDGYLYVLYGNGSLYWSASIGAAYDTAPVVGDLDFDGDLEIIVGSSTGLYAFNSTGGILDGWPKSGITYGSVPALADLDGDGKLEIIVGTKYIDNNKLYVIHGNGTTMWSKDIVSDKIISSPSIADVDGDGIFDVVITSKSGTLYVYSENGDLLSSESLGASIPLTLGSSPALADLDGDGDLEIMVGSYDSKVYVFDTPSTNKFSPWTMFQRNSENTGFYNSPSIHITSPSTGSFYNKSDMIEFNSTAKSPLGLELTYKWYSDKEGYLGTGDNISLSLSTGGNHTISLNVSDNSGNFGVSYRTISINNIPPTVSIHQPLELSVHNFGDNISFNGSASDSDGFIANYTWKANSTVINSDSSANSQNVSSSFNHSSLAIGTFLINFTVWDNDGAQTEENKTIRINSEPTANIISPIDGSSYGVDENITFNGSGTDINGSITSYNWSVDGFQLGSTSTFNTSFSIVGTKTVVLTVTDDLNANGSTSIDINILPVIDSCTTIDNSGSYLLGQNIVDNASSSCINISSSDVVFDGRSYTIDGTDAGDTYGVYVYNSTTVLTNVTVKNVRIMDWQKGIYYNNASDGIIKNNTITSNIGHGIVFNSSNNNIVYNNMFNNTNNFWIENANNNEWNVTIAGNLWTYPNGTGFSEECTDNDGDKICDTSYTLTIGNVDYLPLKKMSGTYEISLVLGWNLISIPLQPTNTSIYNVLSSISGNFTSVWTYSSSSWQRYDLQGPAFLNNLATMEAGKGYWININQGDTLEVSGASPPTSTSLINGWNLVGYNSQTSKSIADATTSISGNFSSVWAYSSGSWQRYDLQGPAFLNNLNTMEAGKGYWINSNQADTLEY